jgi:hypothetical protein
MTNHWRQGNEDEKYERILVSKGNDYLFANTFTVKLLAQMKLEPKSMGQNSGFGRPSLGLAKCLKYLHRCL